MPSHEAHARPVSEHQTSQRLFDEAQRYIPGGVNSPVRAMKGVGMPHPLFVSRARGAHLWDADGNEFVDLVSSWGPMILGWGHPEVVGRPARAARPGHQFRRAHRARGRAGAPHLRGRPVGRARAHGQLRHRGHDERAARGARLHRAREDRQVHRLLPRPRRPLPGGGRQRRAHPGAARQPRRHRAATTADTHPRRVQRRRRAAARSSPRAATQIACVIVEPVAGNMGVVPPQPGFLETARELCTEYGALLIFDEVITGFRVAWGGAQERFGVTARPHDAGQDHRRRPARGRLRRPPRRHGDGGAAGLHLPGRHAVGQSAGHGRRHRHPAVCSREPGVYERLEERAAQVCQGLRAGGRSPAGVPTTLNRVGAMMTLFFCEGPVTELRRRQAPRRHGPPTRATGATCSSAACTWRRRSSSRPWSRWR